MSDKMFGNYMMKVLSYYRSEWTDVSDDDRLFSIVLTRELRGVIKDCMDHGMSVPDAARDVRTFMEVKTPRPPADAGPFKEQGKGMSGGLKELYEDWKSTNNDNETDREGF